MQVQINGLRSNDDFWLRSQQASLHELPVLSADDKAWALSMGASEETYARSLYASKLTLPDLVRKAELVAGLVQTWLTENHIEGKVEAVLLSTSTGIFELTLGIEGVARKIEIPEEMMDDLLQSGSRTAADSLDRLLAANFGRLLISKAS